MKNMFTSYYDFLAKMLEKYGFNIWKFGAPTTKHKLVALARPLRRPFYRQMRINNISKKLLATILV